MDGVLGREGKSVYQKWPASFLFEKPAETRMFPALLNPWQGNAHDTAKRLSLQEVSSNPVLQPLSRTHREPETSRGRLPGYPLKLGEGVRQ